ncbi:SDSL (predicted), partial [Pycnogonum litorale]
MDDLDQKPGCFVLSVGGGGLLCGITEGLHRVGWSDVPVICMETIGADCFTKSVDANRRVRLKEITSIAKTLGADMVCEQAMKWHSKHPMHLFAVPDKMVVDSCLKFA